MIGIERSEASALMRRVGKVYYHAHLVDGFTLPFIIPHVGLYGAITSQANDGRLGSLCVGNNDER